MNGRFDTFQQIISGPVWDGDLISKHDRDHLVEAGYVKRSQGFNFISEEGVIVAVALGLLVEYRPKGSIPADLIRKHGL